MQELQANVEATVLIGPFVDKGDGVTPEEGITLAGADSAEAMKHNGTSFVDIATGNGDQCTLAHKEKGMYTLVIPGQLLDTEGRFSIFISDESVCLPVWKDFMVLAQAAYISKYTAKNTGFMDVDVKAIAGTATPNTGGKLHVLQGDGSAITAVGPTKTEMDNGHTAIVSDTENIEAILGTPANFMANVSAITAAGPTETQLNTAIGLVTAVTNNLPNAGALTDLLTTLGAITAAGPTETQLNTAIGLITSVLGELNTAASSGIPTEGDPAMAYIKQLINDLRTVLFHGRGMSAYAVVTTATSPTEFAASGLDAGHHTDDYFNGWWLFVLDADQGAPLHEWCLVTNFAKTGGVVTHEALTVQLEVDDQILMVNPAIYEPNLVKGVVDAIKTETDDLADGARIDLILDDIDVEVDEILEAVRHIAVTGAALNVVADGQILTTGSEAGTYANTLFDDASYHIITEAGNEIDVEYLFTLPTDQGVPVSVQIIGHLEEGAPAGGDTVSLQAYNYVTPGWDTIDTAVFTGIITSDDETSIHNLLARHVGTSGGNEKKIRLRFYSATLEGSAELHINQIIVSYAEAISTQVAAILSDVTGINGEAMRGTNSVVLAGPTKAQMDAALLVMMQTAAGTYDRDTDSLQAIRDRGDAEWTTNGNGGDATEANQLLLIKILTNKWEVKGNQLIMYDNDGTSALYTFDLTQNGVPTEYNPDLRTPA